MASGENSRIWYGGTRAHEPRRYHLRLVHDLVVIGAGAAGVFAAIQAAENASPPLRALLLEAGRRPLRKVRISGGGRCNVTHAEFDPRRLVTHYPRGARELRGPFSKFAPGDAMAWFEERGVPLKIEADGRVFPVSDDSASVIGALTAACDRLGVEWATRSAVSGLDRDDATDAWEVSLRGGGRLTAKRVLLATGSAPAGYRLAAALGIALVDPAPSLFSFNVPEPRLHALSGLSVPDAEVSFDELPYRTRGPLLATHWGLSGPAVLRASAEAAVDLHARDYEAGFRVSWTGATRDDVVDYLAHGRRRAGRRTLGFDVGLSLPRRLWHYLVERAGCALAGRWADLNASQLARLADVLTADRYRMRGQTRFKEEFVTAGGIDLRELDFRTFAIKRHRGLYAAGELLDIDGVTGGFNFQAAWTGGFLAGRAIAASLAEPGR